VGRMQKDGALGWRNEWVGREKDGLIEGGRLGKERGGYLHPCREKFVNLENIGVANRGK